MGHYRRVLAQVPDNMIPNLKPQSSALKEDITRVCGWVRPDNTEAGAKVEVVDTISPEKVAAAIAELEAGRYPDTVDEGTTSAPFYRKINCESSLRRINVCNQSEFRRASGLRLNEAKTMRQNEMRIDTAPGDLPLIGVLTGAAPPQAEVVAGLESKTQPPILSSRHLYTYLQAITKPDPTILHVHPHPCVSEFICIWVGGRRRSLPRRHYKQALTPASKRRVTGQITKCSCGDRSRSTRVEADTTGCGGLMLGKYRFYCVSNTTHYHSTYRHWLGWGGRIKVAHTRPRYPRIISSGPTQQLHRVIPVTTLVAQYDSGNDVSAEHHTALLTAWRRSGYAAMQMHLPRGTPSAIKKQATQTIWRALLSNWLTW
ncbi:hypothetical protein PC123_g12646 [Phytophthora cactorum]|nr:hypothetical protein PC123_g12646 [Phytophthora cactorum]